MSGTSRLSYNTVGIGAFMCLVTVLIACAPRQSAMRGPALPEATIETIYVATERLLDNTGPSFGEPRNPGLRYFRASIGIPPVHQPGQIEWPTGAPDPAQHFVVTQTDVFESRRAFDTHLRGAQSQQETLVFVHGYNNTLSEAMYRLAQIQTDFNSSVPAVLYSWPSAGDPRGYIYDRDSVLYARDDLEALLKELTRKPGDKVTLLAHSMGSHLVMEALRQAAQKGDRTMLSRISSVVLISPDIDPDVFRTQAQAIGDLPDPFLIFVSQQDQALNLASLITGRKPRLGVIDSPKAVEGLDVSVIDVTALGDGEGFNHSIATSSPAAILVIRGLIAEQQSGGTPFGQYLVLTPTVLDR